MGFKSHDKNLIKSHEIPTSPPSFLHPIQADAAGAAAVSGVGATKLLAEEGAATGTTTGMGNVVLLGCQ